MSEMNVWSARPSIRTHVLSGVLAVGVGAYLFAQVSPAFQSVINATADSFFWSDDLILRVYRTLQVLVFSPLLIVVFLALKTLSTKYEISEGRFLDHHGILIRKHDQVLLHRVRDFSVSRPLTNILVGVGKIEMISRDETHPRLVMGPFKSVLDVEKLLHEAVKAEKEKSGYREFEST